MGIPLSPAIQNNVYPWLCGNQPVSGRENDIQIDPRLYHGIADIRIGEYLETASRSDPVTGPAEDLVERCQTLDIRAQLVITGLPRDPGYLACGKHFTIDATVDAAAQEDHVITATVVGSEITIGLELTAEIGIEGIEQLIVDPERIQRLRQAVQSLACAKKIDNVRFKPTHFMVVGVPTRVLHRGDAHLKQIGAEEGIVDIGALQSKVAAV